MLNFIVELKRWKSSPVEISVDDKRTLRNLKSKISKNRNENELTEDYLHLLYLIKLMFIFFSLPQEIKETWNKRNFSILSDFSQLFFKSYILVSK